MAKEIHFTPAEVVIRSFGGIGKTARALGIDKTSVSQWTNPRRRKVVGLIPNKVQRKVLEVAREMNIQLTTRDIIYGRTVKVNNG